MKNAGLVLFLVFTALCLYGQNNQKETIVLSSKDANPATVRLITNPTNAWQNLVFQFVGKSSLEIKAIVDKQCDAQIMSGGAVVTATDGGCGALIKGTNYIGLVLLFSHLDQARLAENALRGN